jgi:hypothetical protein
MNIAIKGVRKYVANVFGSNAGQASNLFLILKRKYDPLAMEWGAFAFHPYASTETSVPETETLYQGLSGANEHGHVIALGRVRDTYRNSMPPDQLAIAQGISNSTPEREREITKRLPTLDFAIHSRLARVVSACS